MSSGSLDPLRLEPVVGAIGAQGLIWWVVLLALFAAGAVVVWSVRSVWRERNRQLAAAGGDKAGDAGAFAQLFHPTKIADLRPADFRIQRYYSYYHPRTTEDERLQGLLERRENFLLTGLPGAGKSRSLLEALRRCDAVKDYTLLLPDGPIFGGLLDDVAVPKGDYILILDDIDRFCDPQRSARGMLELLEGGRGEVITIGLLHGSIAGSRYEAAGDLFGPVAEVPIPELPRDHLATIAEQTSCQDVLKEAEDQTPLSTLVPLLRLGRRYDNLGPEEKALLASLKALRALNLPLTKTMAQAVFARLCPDTDAKRAIGGIQSNSFVEYENGRFVVSDRVLNELPLCDPQVLWTVVEILQEEKRVLDLWRAALEASCRGHQEIGRTCLESVGEIAGYADPALVACAEAAGLEIGDEEETEEPEPVEEEEEIVNEVKREALELAILGETQEAIRKFREVIADDANDADCHFWLAAMHQKLGELEAAERHFRHGLRADARDARAHQEYGKFLEERQRSRAALGEYLTAALLQVIGGEADPEPFARCSELARDVDDPYTAYLAAAFYVGAVYVTGSFEEAQRIAADLVAEQGKMPIADRVLEAFHGAAEREIEGDDLEAEAARALAAEIRHTRASTAGVD